MSEKVTALRDELIGKLSSADSMQAVDALRVEYLGKNGSITGLLKGMKDLSIEEKKDFGQRVNVLKEEAGNLIASKIEEIKKAEVEAEINSMPEFDISTPANLSRGSYHPITLVQRQCEKVFRSMGLNVEDYSEVVTD